MNEDTRKALELAREALQRGSVIKDTMAIAAIDAALSAPAAPVAHGEPVAWVPVHPRNGPLWANTTADPSPERLPRYPLMPLYAAPKVGPMQCETVEPCETWAYRVIRQRHPDLEVGGKEWLKCLEEMLHWHAAMLAAAPAAPVAQPEWAMVPVEPTPDMVSTARVNMEYESCTPRQVWSAMLAASKTAPVAQPVEADWLSRVMFVARLQALEQDRHLSVESILALLSDCDYLASLSPAPAAPALQALTDEQASTLWRKHLRVSETDGHSIHGGVELIRAIERAHRIVQGGAA